MSNFQLVPLSVVQPWFEAWLNVLRHQEVGTIFFLPHTDLLFRVKQFVAWLLSQHALQVVVIDLEVELIDDPESLIKKLQSTNQPCLILAKRVFVGPDSIRWQAAIELYRTQANVGLLIFHEAAASELSNLKQYNSFLLNQTLYPLYTSEQSLQFSLALAKSWQIALSTPNHLQLVAHCGGVLWFVKEALRQMRDNPQLTLTEVMHSEGFSWKTKQFWQDLPQVYKTALLNPESASSEIISELLAVKLLFANEHAQYTTWPFLQMYLDDSQQNAFSCSADKISYFNQDFTHVFSVAERRVVALLWQKRTQILSRNTLAEAFWAEAEHEKYSDWALDQIMRRLRTKLTKYHLPLTITTHRGRGYVGSI